LLFNNLSFEERSPKLRLIVKIPETTNIVEGIAKLATRVKSALFLPPGFFKDGCGWIGW
jgi:hypothetical protein